MGRRRRNRGRKIDGILLLDKPKGQTSNKVLQQVKRLFKAEKAGHTGSLDPLADGLLPVCLGNATKVSSFLLDSDKHYLVTVQLGVTTTTGDSEGDILKQSVVKDISEDTLLKLLGDFIGPQKQLPPMYSALKHEGERLYKLAREGKVVEREPRDIEIYDIRLLHFALPELTMQVDCSKGTYVRTLAEDIGEKLGCGAHVNALRRNGVGPYGDEDMVTLEEIEKLLDESDDLQQLDKLLLPIDTALQDWPKVQLNNDSAYYLKQGQPILVPRSPTEGWIRIYEEEAFIGIGQIDDQGRVAPKRLMATN